jgi:penicillin-binding protein 1A
MRIIKFFAVLVLLVAILAGAAGGLAVWYFDRDLPDYQQLVDYQPSTVSRTLAGDGRLMAEYATERRVFVPVSAMPPLVVHAFLAAEDRNFYSHMGIDPLAMIRAAATDVLRVSAHRRPVGASTITQQVAKNFLLGNEVSYRRKIREALVALRMEKALSKDRILELYLNEIYLGGGAYGVASAALTYFNKSLDELTVDEAALLGALPKAPATYNPLKNPEQAQKRRDWVIDRMVEAGFITPEQGKAAQARPITIRHRGETETTQAPYFTEEVRRELLTRYGEKGLYQSGLTVRTSLDPTLQADAEAALRGALIAYDRRHGYRGPVAHGQTVSDWRTKLASAPLPPGAADVGWKIGLVLATPPDGATIGLADGTQGRIPFEELRWARRVADDEHLGPPPRTTADAIAVGDIVLVEPLAKAADGKAPGSKTEDAKAEGKTVDGKGPDAKARKTIDLKAEAKGLPLYGLRQIPEVSGGLVVMDPHTGRVLAMIGGFSYDISQFDRATQAVRQTGSSIKPFIYLAALDHGFTPSTLVLDAPFVIDPGPGQPQWRPANYEHNFLGAVPMRIGLEESRNLMTARIGAQIGLDVVGQYIERFGIMEHMPREYSMLIGADETTLLKMTTAYAMLDNGGKRVTPSFIDRVQDREGVTIFRADNRPCVGCNGVEWTGQAPPELPDTREQIADAASVYQTVSLMEGVIERGTGRGALVVGKPLAGKTGTTNDSDDTWFLGFSPDLVCGVFIGYDTPRSLGNREAGATVALPAFRDFMLAALKDTPAIPFRTPPGIRLVRVNPATGQLARAGDKTVIYEAFKPGTEPTGNSQVITGGAGVSEDADATPAAATAGGDAAGDAAAVRQAVPASGTGGLY